MKKMTLGKQIGLGFGILLTITLLLGGLAVYNMNSAAKNASKMANVYVPELSLVLMFLEWQTMLAMRLELLRWLMMKKH